MRELCDLLLVNTLGDVHIISTDNFAKPLVMRIRLPQPPRGPANPRKSLLRLLCQFAQLPCTWQEETPPSKKRKASSNSEHASEDQEETLPSKKRKASSSSEHTSECQLSGFAEGLNPRSVVVKGDQLTRMEMPFMCLGGKVKYDVDGSRFREAGFCHVPAACMWLRGEGPESITPKRAARQMQRDPRDKIYERVAVKVHALSGMSLELD